MDRDYPSTQEINKTVPAPALADATEKVALPSTSPAGPNVKTPAQEPSPEPVISIRDGKNFSVHHNIGIDVGRRPMVGVEDSEDFVVHDNLSINTQEKKPHQEKPPERPH